MFSLLRHSRREFVDKVLTFAESRIAGSEEPASSGLQVSAAALMERCGDLAAFIEDPPLQAVRRHVEEKQQTRPRSSSVTVHDARLALATFCYCLCRASKPDVVLETGVGNGVTTAFILTALSVNGAGALWSIDLPPLGAEERVGAFVPANLSHLWRLRRGRSRRELPRLLSELPSVDVFLHDSLHTYRNMQFEFSSVWPKLRQGGILVSDDVAFNHAFETFVTRPDVSFAGTDEDSFFGVAIKSR